MLRKYVAKPNTASPGQNLGDDTRTHPGDDVKLSAFCIYRLAHAIVRCVVHLHPDERTFSAQLPRILTHTSAHTILPHHIGIMAALCRASSLSCTSSSTCTLGSRSSLQLADLPALPRAAGCVRPSLARRAAARCPTCKDRRALAVRVSAQKDGLAAFRDDVAKFIGVRISRIYCTLTLMQSRPFLNSL